MLGFGQLMSPREVAFDWTADFNSDYRYPLILGQTVGKRRKRGVRLSPGREAGRADTISWIRECDLF